MSWFYANLHRPDHRAVASRAQIEECFRNERSLLTSLAFLITGNEAVAEQSVVHASEMTLENQSPFQDWLMEWAKTATLSIAIQQQLEDIRACEATYRNQRCRHVEHQVQGDAEGRQSDLKLILECEPSIIVRELDPLSRAILVLRVATRSSIQDCVFRLNLSRTAVLAANCRAMTWLADFRTRQFDTQEWSPEADSATSDNVWRSCQARRNETGIRLPKRERTHSETS